MPTGTHTHTGENWLARKSLPNTHTDAYASASAIRPPAVRLHIFTLSLSLSFSLFVQAYSSQTQSFTHAHTCLLPDNLCDKPVCWFAQSVQKKYEKSLGKHMVYTQCIQTRKIHSHRRHRGFLGTATHQMDIGDEAALERAGGPRWKFEDRVVGWRHLVDMKARD